LTFLFRKVSLKIIPKNKKRVARIYENSQIFKSNNFFHVLKKDELPISMDNETYDRTKIKMVSARLK